MFLVEEKMGAAAVDEEDELLLVFWRLAGGEVAALLVPVVCSHTLGRHFLKEGVWSCFFRISGRLTFCSTTTAVLLG
jgi:hypothetical protein